MKINRLLFFLMLMLSISSCDNKEDDFINPFTLKPQGNADFEGTVVVNGLEMISNYDAYSAGMIVLQEYRLWVLV